MIIILQCISRVNFNSLSFSYIFQVLFFLSHFYFYSRLIGLSGDVGKNSGPNSKADQGFSICHWNFNNIAAHNFSKIQSQIAYNCIHNFDIICLFEMYLNSDISSDNENLDVSGYILVRSDHPFNDKRGGVCVYFKSSSSLQILSISMLHECINLEIRIDDKLCNLICLYRSPSQNMEEFETSVKNLELNLELIFTKYPYLTVVIGDFNVKSQNWYKDNKTRFSGTKLEIMTSHYGLTTQIINEPALILEDASSCIALTLHLSQIWSLIVGFIFLYIQILII